jgi:hypothetical protein
MQQPDRPAEARLREQLGIPADARHVLVFGETSHWDPNWLRTSEEYFDARVRHTLDAALRVLRAEPKRVYSLESTFFLRMYWERSPERRDELRERINSGRIRLTGTAVTTPDTTLPVEEAIFRDYLAGRAWLRSQGMTAEPRLAYLPDNFGNSPALPSLLAAMGLRYAAMSRIDGMHFPGDDYRGAGFYPRPGSSARMLQELGTLDFVWRAPDGHETLCHWNAFTYFQGDMLAWRGIIRWMNRVFGWRDRGAGHVAGKILGHARKLMRLSKTPYLFCPIGCDFNDPIEDLTGLLARYNEQRYERTGIYAVNACLEDYLDLVSHWQAELPTVQLDPNPYWMGFYASRPQLKQRCRQLTCSLLQAEKLLVTGEPAAASEGVLRDAWERVVLSNHHDFITGTAPDRVHGSEQERWLAEAEALVAAAQGMAAHGRPAAVAPAAPQPPDWSLRDGVLEVATADYRICLREDAGGCITSWQLAGSERNLVRTASNDLICYRDTGGLWRMGHEFRGGSFREVDRASSHPASFQAEVQHGLLRVQVDSVLAGRPVLRTLWFRSDSPVVKMTIRGRARRRTTVTCRFHPAVRPDGLVMDVPGGVVTRSFGKGMAPTFWAAANFVHVRDREDGHGMVAFLGGPGCVSADPHGGLEWVALRNAPKEQAWGLLPIPAHPARGDNDAEHGLDYAVGYTEAGDWRDNALAASAERVLWDGTLEREAVGSWLQVPAGVVVRAAKRAEDGRGRIVRLGGHSPGAWQVRSPGMLRAMVCDALERDVQEVQVVDGMCTVQCEGTIVSLRLM